MTIKVRFMSLTGKFCTVREQEFPDSGAALEAVKAHAASGGMTHVKSVDDHDDTGWRYTARTPGGRGGRNIAFADNLEDW